MEIYVASITHRHGTNTYAARSSVGIDRQLADFCRENWALEGVPGEYEGLSDSQVITEYFEFMSERDEYYNIDRITLED